MNVTPFLEAFGSWASARADIEAVALVGSHARGAATEGSDVDLVVLTPNVAGYVRELSWVSLFGDPSECAEEDWGRLTSVRVFYREGLEVEYGFSTPDWAGSPVDAGTAAVVSDDMKILYDPQGVLDRLRREVSSDQREP